MLEREDLLGEVFRLVRSGTHGFGIASFAGRPAGSFVRARPGGEGAGAAHGEELARLLDDAESLCLDLLEND